MSDAEEIGRLRCRLRRLRRMVETWERVACTLRQHPDEDEPMRSVDLAEAELYETVTARIRAEVLEGLEPPP